MKKVHFSPLSAIRYVGDEPKEFSASLARPKPVLEYGDIVILDKRTAYNLVKGFGQYESVETIEIHDADELLYEIEHLKIECERLKDELAKALEFLSVDDETLNPVEAPVVDETVQPVETPVVDETEQPKITRGKITSKKQS
jgi:hypothetical protein